MRTIKFLIVYLFLTTNLLSAEIEILVDKPGEGKKIINHSWVQIEYTGSFIDGKVFDTNVGKDRPLVVQIGMREVIPGFEMGIVGTNKGTIRKIKIPSELADGSSGAGDVINVYLMDRVRALAGAESQNIEIIFVSNDGETASILGNAFAEDLGFKNVYVLKGGIKAWINEEKALVSFLK